LTVTNFRKPTLYRFIAAWGPRWEREAPTNKPWEFLRNQSIQFSCPVCPEPLVPVSSCDRFDFAFGCSEGHVVSLEHLFKEQAAALRASFDHLIETWEKSIAQMSEGAEIARRHGSEKLALRLGERVTILEGKVRLMRETFFLDPGTNREPPAP